MTKNLKLKVKNTQLAGILKKNKLKKEPLKETPAKKPATKAPSKKSAEADKAIPTGEEKSPKKVVRARKLPSSMMPSKEETPASAPAKPTPQPSAEKSAVTKAESRLDALLKTKEKQSSTKNESETQEKPAKEEVKSDTYRPTKSGKIVKRKMIETPIVRKKEPYKRPPRPEPSKKPTSETKSKVAPRKSPSVADSDKGAIKRVDKKKGSVYTGSSSAKAADKAGAKKAPPSYRRQAFSRVFDSRSIDGEETWRRRRHNKQKRKRNDEPVIRPSEVSVVLPITVKELASLMKIKGTEVIQKLFMQGLPITINDALEDETTVEIIGQEFDCKIYIDKTQEARLQVTKHSIENEITETDAKDLAPRAPVVTVMGHVDHGKTSIIDAFRKSNLTSSEAGAITQHIGAFKVSTDHGNFTVLDTPGHEAFSAIRARGANVTDIIVLVIAGDEGIKPQTKEAMDKAKEADVPIIVAINKLDKPGFNVDEIYRQLSENELLPEAWGGEVLTVNCSAKTGEGIETLSEMIALQTEVLELKANPTSRARGAVLESELNRGLGITATLLIQNGTLNVGDAVIFEHEYGRIKTMQDEYGKKLQTAPPSSAVKVTGLSGVPRSGSEFVMLDDEKEARKISEERCAAARHEELKKRSSKSLEHLLEDNADRQRKKTLNIILKADVGGSLEAVRETLQNIPTDKVELNFITAGVGQVSESDIEMANTSGAIIVGFHTNIESHAEQLLKNMKVKVILFDVIYHLVDEVKEYMITILDKLRQETEVASAKVLAIFKSSHLGIIAGCQVTEGTVKRSYFARLFRGDEEIWSGNIASLKRHQDDVKEVKKDLECGIVLDNTNNLQAEDVFKFYEITFITQEL